MSFRTPIRNVNATIAGSSAGPSIRVRGSAGSAVSYVSNTNITIPSSAKPGDLLVAVAKHSGNSYMTVPNGLTFAFTAPGPMDVYTGTITAAGPLKPGGGTSWFVSNSDQTAGVELIVLAGAASVALASSDATTGSGSVQLPTGTVVAPQFLLPITSVGSGTFAWGNAAQGGPSAGPSWSAAAAGGLSYGVSYANWTPADSYNLVATVGAAASISLLTVS